MPSSDTVFTDCGSETLTMPRAGQALVLAHGTNFNPVTCRLEVDDGTSAIPHATTTFSGGTVAINAVTSSLSAAQHQFELSCRAHPRPSGLTTTVSEVTVTAVMIGTA